MHTARNPRKTLDSLEALNRRSRDLAYGIEDLDWSREVDRSRPWAPDDLGPLWFAPSFRKLGAAEGLRCNQLNALAQCEKLAWFEAWLVRIADNVSRIARVPAPVEEGLRHFVAEESKHIEMFQRLLQRAEPGWYETSPTRFFTITPPQRSAMNVIAAWPQTLLAWIWLAAFVEERALFFSRRYALAERRAPGRIDALFAEVQAFHARDEARHQQLGPHLLTWLYDSQPEWKKRLCGFTFERMLRGYIAGGRASSRILDQLAAEFPALDPAILARIRRELAAVGADPAYHRDLFGRAAMPRTLRLMAEYAELDSAWFHFKAQSRSEVLQWTR
jgi:hypothetical protein